MTRLVMFRWLDLLEEVLDSIMPSVMDCSRFPGLSKLCASEPTPPSPVSESLPGAVLAGSISFLLKEPTMNYSALGIAWKCYLLRMLN